MIFYTCGVLLKPSKQLTCPSNWTSFPKVDNVSDFGFHLKNLFMFHVLAEFFLRKVNFEDAFFTQFLQVQSELCFMFWEKSEKRLYVSCFG